MYVDSRLLEPRLPVDVPECLDVVVPLVVGAVSPSLGPPEVCLGLLPGEGLLLCYKLLNVVFHFPLKYIFKFRMSPYIEGVLAVSD